MIRMMIFAVILLISSPQTQAVIKWSQSPIEVIPFAYCSNDECKFSVTLKNITGENISLESNLFDTNDIMLGAIQIFDAKKLTNNSDIFEAALNAKTGNLAAKYDYKIKLNPHEHKTFSGVLPISSFGMVNNGDYLFRVSLLHTKLYVNKSFVTNISILSDFTPIYGYEHKD